MAKKESEPKVKKRSHRAQFPTPGFYLFAFLLNLLAFPVAAMLYWGEQDNLPLMILAGLTLLGVIMAGYSASLRPKESNKRARKVLVASTTIYGVSMLIVQILNLVVNPNIIGSVDFSFLPM